MQPGIPTLLTVHDVAQVLQVTDDTVRNLLRQGKMRYLNLGSEARPQYRVRPEALMHYLENFERRAVYEEDQTKLLRPIRQRRSDHQSGADRPGRRGRADA